MYKTVFTPSSGKYSEKKSDFLSVIAPAVSEPAALSFIDKVRAEHRKARHNCYAYIIRESGCGVNCGDGEPAGTVPVLALLQKEGLTDVVCVVTRYFGGILLGAGGLTRAYVKAVSAAVAAADTAVMRECAGYAVNMPHPDYGLFRRTADKYGAVRTDVFSDTVQSEVKIFTEKSAPFLRELTDFSGGRIKCVFTGNGFMRDS